MNTNKENKLKNQIDDVKKKHQAYVLKLETELHELEQREEAATHRMQLLVYPATVVFIILSAYGFYLVSSLTRDVGLMADSVQTMYQTVDTHMNTISNDTVAMSKHMDRLIDNTEDMNANINQLLANTQHMTTNVTQMSLYTGYMQQDLWSLNKNISKPLRFVNTFIPWSSNTSDSQPFMTYRVPYSPVPTTMMQQKAEPQQTLPPAVLVSTKH